MTDTVNFLAPVVATIILLFAIVVIVIEMRRTL